MQVKNLLAEVSFKYIYIYIYIYVCVCVCIYINFYQYISKPMLKVYASLYTAI